MSSAVVVPEGDLSADEARDLTDQIKVAVEGTWQLVKRAYELRAWSSLGYASWDDYCTREFGTSRLRLPREERQEVVASLREAGLSVRAIKAATGLSNGGVHRSLTSGVPNGTPREEVTGTDGKTYPAKPRDVMAFLDDAAKRHSPSGKTRAAVEVRVAKAKEMAEQGHTSRQIAAEIGISPESMPQWRDRHGVEVPADAAMGKSRRHDANRILAETVTTLEAVVMGLGVIEVDQLDPDRIEVWATSLTDSTRSLNRFLKQIKEMTRGSE